MPIKPEHRHHYRGKAWRDARAAVIARAGDACECVGDCGKRHEGGRCGAPNRAAIMRVRAEPFRFIVGVFEHRGTALLPPVRVVLTVAHLDHNPGVNDLERLRAFCQYCHLRYDAGHHAESAAATRRAKRDAATGQGALALGRTNDDDARPAAQKGGA